MKKMICGLILLGLSSVSNAALISTSVSPTTNGDLSATGISSVGGIVFDFVGLNGNSIVAQLAASDLFRGRISDNPLLLGTQTGFTSSLLSILGGGLSEVAVRLTLFDGDSAAGDFDFNDNTLLLNGIGFGNFSNIFTENTDSNGTTVNSSNFGFSDAELGTGWFYSNDSGVLGDFFATLAGGSVDVFLDDLDPGDNYLDFTQGLDGTSSTTSLEVTTITKVSEPNTFLLTILSIAALSLSLRYRS